MENDIRTPHFATFALHLDIFLLLQVTQKNPVRRQCKMASSTTCVYEGLLFLEELR